MFTETKLQFAMAALGSETGLDSLLLAFVLGYGDGRQGFLHFDDGGVFEFLLTKGMNIGDLVSQLVSCLVLLKGMKKAVSHFSWDDVYCCALADNIYLTGPAGRVMKVARAILQACAGTWVGTCMSIVLFMCLHACAQVVAHRLVRSFTCAF